MPRKNNIKNTVKDAVDDARDKVDYARDKTEDFIKNNPLTSVAIAAAVGAIVALGVNALVAKEKKPFYRRFRDFLD